MSGRNMVISLIGRPNVGKSSIFNCLMKVQYKAITYDMPGVTRDRHYGIAHFNELKNENECDAILVDTGGFYPQKIDEETGTEDQKKSNKFFNIMTHHAQIAIEESDLVLFVVDVREGVLPFDQQICKYIRSRKKDFIVLINKFDTQKQEGQEIDFYSLGIDSHEMMLVSAAHGLGVANLKEEIHRRCALFEKLETKNSSLLQKGVTPREEVVARMAIIGAPNAGKSTLLNQLVGAERALVSDIAGTTVDPIEGYFDIFFGDKIKELTRQMYFSKTDRLLFQQYDEFRKNNPDVYSRMTDAYVFEEEVSHEFDEDDEFYDDEIDYELLSEDELEALGDHGIEDQENDNDEDAQNRLYEQAFSEDLKDSEEALNESDVRIEEEAFKGSLWRSLHLVDTAGIRRKKSIDDFVEGQSVYRSLRCISESDIVIYMVDATKGIGHQDRRLLDIALEKGKSLIVCLNKMDLLKDRFENDKERREWLEDLRVDIPWLSFCDIVPISAKKNTGLKRLKQAIIKTVLVRRRSISTGELNRAMFELMEKNPIVLQKSGGKKLKVKYASMIKSDPPTFLMFSNKSKGIPDNYKRYLKNGLRSYFELDNTPIHMIFRTGTELEKRMKKVRRKVQSEEVTNSSHN